MLDESLLGLCGLYVLHTQNDRSSALFSNNDDGMCVLGIEFFEHPAAACFGLSDCDHEQVQRAGCVTLLTLMQEYLLFDCYFRPLPRSSKALPPPRSSAAFPAPREAAKPKAKPVRSAILLPPIAIDKL